MLWAFKQLTVPTNYLRIRHGHGLFRSKLTYDLTMPVLLAFATGLIFKAFGTKFDIFSNTDLIKRIQDLLALMIAFYMAALAAVSTFDRKGIDARLPDEDALLRIRDKFGNKQERPLSYRQFISYVFGYLSFLSLCLYMFMTIVSFVWADFVKLFTSKALCAALSYAIEPIIFFVTFFAIWQLMVTSLLGIYFLTERIQTLSES